jgi:hypothetical protein
MVYSQKPLIKTPHSGEKWTKGHLYVITWDKIKKQATRKIKILLYKASFKRQELITVTEDDGIFKWRIPKSIPIGRYLIIIKAIDNSQWYKSGMFYIVDKSLIPKIQIIKPSPNRTDKVCKGEKLEIQWKYYNIHNTGSDVNIKVYMLPKGICNNNIYNVTMFDKNIRDTGHYSWRVPLPLLGGLFKVKITKGGYSSFSNCFIIKPHCFISDKDANYVRNYNFSTVSIKKRATMPDVLPIDITEIINVLRPIKHAYFEIEFRRNNSSKTILEILPKGVIGWYASHKGNIVFIKLKQPLNNINNFYIDIRDVKTGEVLKTIGLHY